MKQALLISLLAASITASVATPASAQRYFMRERIVGVSRTQTQDQPATKTYVPTYSTTYSACSGGKQSAPIASCSTGDGQPAALSDCSSSPQSVQKDCTVPTPTCGPVTAKQIPTTTTTSYNLGTYSYTTTTVDTVCNAYIKAKGLTGPLVCFTNTDNPQNAKAYLFVSSSTTYYDSPTQLASVCK